MNLMKFENFKPLLTLSTICIVVALLLAAINTVTAPIIEEAQKNAISESLKVVMPDGEFNNEPDELSPDAPETVKEIYTEKNGKGYVAVLLTTKGYTGKAIGMTVAIDTEGNIIKMVVTRNEESIVPSILKPGGSYGDAYAGANADTVADVSTGATVKYTEAAIKSALSDVFTYLDFKEPEKEIPLSKNDEEIVSLAKEMVDGAVSFTDVTPEGLSLVKRVYRENGGKGYAVYTQTISQYGTPDTETLFFIDTDGKILSAKKVLFKTSDAIYGYVPPTEESVNAFYERLAGNDSESIGAVELVTNATNTSTAVINSVNEAISVVKELISSETFTKTEEEMISFADAFVGGAVSFTNVTPDGATLVRRIYRENSGKGYVVFTQTIASNYGTPDTETVIHVGNDGKILKAEKILWKTSDAIYGYVPPTEESVNAFYDRLLGNSSESIGAVELVTNATNTSTSLRNSIAEALSSVDALRKTDIVKTDAEIVAALQEMRGDSAEFTNITPGNRGAVRRVYRTSDGEYGVFVQTIAERYGTVDTATLIYVGADGKIKAAEKVVWKVSDPLYGFVPPSEDEVDAFYGRLLGVDADEIGSVELISGATNTSTSLRNSLKNALSVVEELIKNEKDENGGNG